MKNKIAMLLLSFAVAMGLWLYVVTTVSPDYDQNFYGIPVSFENETTLMDRELMMVSGQNATVAVRLQGNRSDLNRLGAGNIFVAVDLGAISEPGHYEREYRVTFPSGYSSVTLARRLTATVGIDIVEYATKEVPVKLVFRGELEKGLILDQEEAVLSATSVTVSGPKSEVDQVSYAGIDIDRTSLTENLTGEFIYTLRSTDDEPVDSKNVTTDTGEIRVFLPVEHIKEIPLRVELISGGGATADNAECTLEPATLMISGSQEALDKIEELMITTVDLAAVDNNGFAEDVEIRLPENLTNRSNIASVHVDVQLKGLGTKSITVSKDRIQVVHVPEGLEANVLTQQMAVMIRGPVTELSKLTADQITITVDMSNQAQGTYTLAPTIQVNGSDRVGAMGKYIISVSLAPPVEPTEPEETTTPDEVTEPAD